MLATRKLDRFGGYLRYLINQFHDLTGATVDMKAIVGTAANLNNMTAGGLLVFGIFAKFTKFHRQLALECADAGLVST
ncbi:hypothetical protein AruPA_21230 [Acidiphilium sp. PA]|uniref:hypothetical protein n=1 Tax=Acidiphilium sp. PA TaxID=2871705 RepID=UPI0022434E48|nr:hypothetical protein [Acidiphilium sp. PA]MCW8309539.1 hypothetical protein [Acidiphilium sp. PA]